MDQKWWIDLNSGTEYDTNLVPNGYSKKFEADKTVTTSPAKAVENMLELKRKRANELGWGPCKSLLQTGFMMWMSGSSVNIFSIMVTGMVIMNTVRSLGNVQKALWMTDASI